MAAMATLNLASELQATLIQPQRQTKNEQKTWKTRTYLLGVWYLFPDAHENVDLSLLTTCPTREPIAGLKI